jgi:hypothetical protein
MGREVTWTPPTPVPAAGQGPWCDPNLSRWWVVTDDPDDPVEAVRVINGTDADTFPCYFAWRAVIEPVAIHWVSPDEWDDEHEIVEAEHHDEETTAKAWRITFEDTIKGMTERERDRQLAATILIRLARAGHLSCTAQEAAPVTEAAINDMPTAETIDLIERVFSDSDDTATGGNLCPTNPKEKL